MNFAIRHKLYLQIYLGFVASLVIFALLAGVAWKVFGPNDQRNFGQGITTLIAQALPLDAAPQKIAESMATIALAFHVELSLYDQNNNHIYSTQKVMPLPPETNHHHGFIHGAQPGHFFITLADGRKLIIFHPNRFFGGPPLGFLLLLIVLALAAYPLSKRLTCRLESLNQQVQRFGEGDLTARATIKGKDEIAELARTFNATANRIEHLIQSQKQALAGASHELRSPLTRMRMALEVNASENDESLKSQLLQNIAALDALVGELLLSSKLDAGTTTLNKVSMDLLALTAEVAAHYNAETEGSSALILADELMIRRVLTNLLDNAKRYQRKVPIHLRVHAEDDWVILKVCDDGPGINEEDLPHVFTPFYQSRQADKQTGSLGMGLSIVEKIVHQHNGEIVYRNDLEGTCFEVRLPRHHSE
ncbi:MAG: hypothetical protein AUK35_04490 [Zetaproteobacteria bacterium CG2_30_46_52]|nr:MAG: hypothetical protein AUK35_04490 [Zetaproteobacteria bacterium CG2_30_46_52]